MVFGVGRRHPRRVQRLDWVNPSTASGEPQIAGRPLAVDPESEPSVLVGHPRQQRRKLPTLARVIRSVDFRERPGVIVFGAGRKPREASDNGTSIRSYLYNFRPTTFG